jgi:predicted TIM-barrel fold metal-dependent hydrolase
MRQFTSLLFQGVPERFPRLTLGFAEIGATWLPYWLDRMDEHWELRGEVETPALTRRPSEVVRQRPLYFTFEAEETLLPETIRLIGEDRLAYATDFPHWDSGFPKNMEHVRARTDLPEAVKPKLLAENARRWYRL